MTKRLHPLAGAVALTTMLVFWVATVGAEISGHTETIIAVKLLIPWGFLLLLPALAATVRSGFALSAGWRGGTIDAKKRRVPVIAANGLLILIPGALFLAWKAHAGALDAAFYAVQALELAAGAANIVLLGMNFRDGLAMTGRLQRMRRGCQQETSLR